MQLEQAVRKVAHFATGLRTAEDGAAAGSPPAALGQAQQAGAPGSKPGGKAAKRRGAASGAALPGPTAKAEGAGAAGAAHPGGPAADLVRLIQPWQAGPLALEVLRLCLRYLALVRCSSALLASSRHGAGQCSGLAMAACVLLALQRACPPAHACPHLPLHAVVWPLLPLSPPVARWAVAALPCLPHAALPRYTSLLLGLHRICRLCCLPAITG